MTITRYRRRADRDPMSAFYGFPELFSERMFDFPSALGRERDLGFEGAWHPSADIYEDGDNVFVKMDLPGMSKDEIDISFDGHVLSITGRRKEEELKESERYWSRERYFGEFHRYVHIPAEVSSDDLKANYDEGVLRVSLHKTNGAKRKKIAIESG